MDNVQSSAPADDDLDEAYSPSEADADEPYDPLADDEPAVVDTTPVRHP